eukprot:Selendium_serpulae@DN5127_c0_g1_i2.p2
MDFCRPSLRDQTLFYTLRNGPNGELQRVCEEIERSMNEQRGNNRTVRTVNVEMVEKNTFTFGSLSRSDKVGSETFKSCPVCLFEFSPEDDVLKLPCEHLFHPDCVNLWIRQSPYCPLCRENLTAICSSSDQNTIL